MFMRHRLPDIKPGLSLPSRLFNKKRDSVDWFTLFIHRKKEKIFIYMSQNTYAYTLITITNNKTERQDICT